jgi:hypothetical protein
MESKADCNKNPEMGDPKRNLTLWQMYFQIKVFTNLDRKKYLTCDWLQPDLE